MSGARTVPRAVGITAVRDPAAQHHDVYPDVLVHCGGCALHADEQHYDVCDTFTLEFCLPHGIGEQGHSRHKDSFEHHVDDGELHHDVEGYALMHHISIPRTTDVQHPNVHYDARGCTLEYGLGISPNTGARHPSVRRDMLGHRMDTAVRTAASGPLWSDGPGPPHAYGPQPVGCGSSQNPPWKKKP